MRRTWMAVALAVLAQSARGATTVEKKETTAQQAVLQILTDQSSCSIRVSTVNDFGANYAPIPDVDPSLFEGADRCDRVGSIGPAEGRLFVVGKRAAELSADGKTRVSRSLQALTTYYYQVLAGADEVTGSFQTRNIPAGNTRNDARFDRQRPGEYAYPTPPWDSPNKVMVDPHTGAAVRLLYGPGKAYLTSNTGVAMAQAVGGSGWSVSGNNGGSYSGSARGFLFLRPDTSSTDGLQRFGLLDWVQLTARLSGSTASVDVCLTVNRVSCSGAVLTRAVTSSASNYTFGSTVPVLDAWKNSPSYPATVRDFTRYSGSVTVSGTTVTQTGGDLFSTDWTAGSKITLDSTECEITSLADEKTLTIQPSCVSDGNKSYTARNGGFLIRPSGTGSTTLSVANATWSYRTSGQPSMSTYGAPRMCQNVAVNGGYLCADSGIYDSYSEGNGIYWISPTESRLIGLTVATIGATGLQPSTVACPNVNEGAIWDANVPGKFYCRGLMAASGNQAIYSVTYSGDYSAVSPPPKGASLTPATTVVELADLSGAVEAFTASDNPSYQRTFDASGSAWTILFQQSGKLIARSRIGAQDSVSWTAVWDPATKRVVAAISSWGGLPGTPNRWCGDHSTSIGGDSTWLYMTCNSAGYYVSVAAGSLTSTFAACPANSIQPEVQGRSQCSTVTLASLVPTTSAGASLYGRTLVAGDFLGVRSNGNGDGEVVRILGISGNDITVLRMTRDADASYKPNHSGTLSFSVEPSAFKEMWWNWGDDPHAQTLTKAYGATIREDPHSANCHQVFEGNFFIAGCGKVSQFGYNRKGTMVRNGALPESFAGTPYWVDFDAPFAGSTNAVPLNYLETHPSHSQYAAPASEQSKWFDQRTYLGDPTIATQPNVAKVGTYLYRVSASATASMQYRLQGYVATSGAKVLADVSPAVLTDTPADHYKFCVVVKAGDCAENSVVGQVYLNIPQATQGYVYPSRFSTTPGLRDVSLAQNTASLQAVIQLQATALDTVGASVRRLATAFAPYKVQSVFWNGRATPDGRRYFFKTDQLDGIAGALLLLDLPPWPTDVTFRGDFLTQTRTISGSPGDEVRVRFGYAENGPPDAYFCHERQVSCVVTPGGGQPFKWTDESEGWFPCGSECSVTLPAIPGRVLYWAVDRRKDSQVTTEHREPIAVP